MAITCRNTMKKMIGKNSAKRLSIKFYKRLFPTLIFFMIQLPDSEE